MRLHQTKKVFFTAKETTTKSPKWKKIFTNDTANKGLKSKIQTEFIQLNTNPRPQTIQLKVGRGPE